MVVNLESEKYCYELTKKTASSFYYGILSLPSDKRKAFYALYTWMRLLDDIVDNTKQRDLAHKLVLEFQKKTHDQFSGKARLADDHWPELERVQKQFGLDPKLFDEVVAGVLMDLEKHRYANSKELYEYCYKVASVVGLLCLRIFGTSSEGAKALAIELGYAFQLTNIIRDVGEDALRGRIYIPLDLMARHDVLEEDVLSLKMTTHLKKVLAELAQMATEHYAHAKPLILQVSSDSRPALKTMYDVYSELLQKMKKNHFDIFSKRVKLSFFDKIKIILTNQFLK